MIGIVIPTPLEADAILSALRERQHLVIQNKSFYKGILKGKTLVSVCICGIGKTNAAHGTALLIEKFLPAHIYLIGVAGAYPSSRLGIGDVALAEKELYGDEGLAVSDGFKQIDILLNCSLQESRFCMQNEFSLFIPQQLNDYERKGTFITVSACTGTLKRSLEIERQFKGIAENMEGAAVAHVCALNSIPLTEIRGISNIIGDRDAIPLPLTEIILAAGNAQRFFSDYFIP